MSKFKVGDHVRKINDDFLGSFSIGEELVVTGISVISGILYYRVARSIGEETDSAYASDLELVSETPTEITLNGATYVLKEEPKSEHEWKFGDIAAHKQYGVGIVVMTDDEDGDFYFAQAGDNNQRIKWAVDRDLTFLRRADLSV